MPVIKFRNGLEANRPTSALAGEPLFCTDSGLLLVDNGVSLIPTNGVIADTYANRPAAGIEGRWFFATDTYLLYRDSGSAWVGVALGTPAPIELQNSQIMLAWDMAVTDPRFDDAVIEDFADSNFIDPSSVGTYDDVNDCYKKIVGSTGNTDPLAFDADTKVFIPDLKGSITNWVQDSGATGHFTDGTNSLSLGSGNDCPDVVVGLEVVFGDASTAVITGITGDGSGNGAVTLSETKTSTTVSKVRGAKIASSKIIMTGVPGTAGQTAGRNNTVSEHISDYNNGVTLIGKGSYAQIPNGAIITKVGWRAYHEHTNNDDGTVKFKIAKDNGDGTYDLTDIHEESFTGYNSNAYREYTLTTEFHVPLTGNYYIAYSVSAPFSNWYYSGGWYYPIFGESLAAYTVDSKAGDQSGDGIGTWTSNSNMLLNMLVTYTAKSTPPNKTVVVRNSDANAWDSSGWSHIESAAIVQEKAGSANVYWAYSWDNNATYWAWTGSAWRQIVRQNGGTWEYQNNSEVWTTAHVNTLYAALEDAFGQSDNQCGEATVEAISQASWEATNGFNPGTTTEVNVAIGLDPDASNNGANVTSHTFTYSIVDDDITLVLSAWEASTNDPDNGYAVLKIKDNTTGITLGTDLRAYLSMDDGTNYEEITGLEKYQTIDVYDFIRGDVTGLTPRTDKTIRGKIETHNNVDVELHGVAFGVSYE